MQRSGIAFVLHGAVGGIVAGVLVAVWFLVYDVATTEAFYTPSLLAATMLGEQFQWPTFRLLSTYTVLHLGVFALLGVGTAWFLRTIGVGPGILVGAVFGVGVLNAVHYGGLMMTGVDLLTVLPVGHVVAANLIGGMLMMAYLHRASRAESRLGLATLADHQLLADGLATGLLGAGAVALWFLVVDMMTSVPFFTPAALGSAILLGATTPAEVQVNIGIIAAYSFLHVLAFAVVGWVLAWVAKRIERAPGFWLLAVMAFIVVEALFVAIAGILGGWVLGSLGWLQIGIGNLIAVGAMGTWLWRTHPQLKERLVQEPVATQV